MDRVDELTQKSCGLNNLPAGGKGIILACLGEIQKERNHDLEMWSKMEDERGSGRGGEGDFRSKLF